MLTVDVVNEKLKATGQVELSAEIFGRKMSRGLLHEAVTLWMRNLRAGTVSTKGRSQVSGGGRKPWRQKGTGRARAGSTRSPVWVGGGTVFGPKPRDYSSTVGRRKRKLALASALSHQLRKGNIVFLEGLEMEVPKTARVVECLASLGCAGKKVLLVIPNGLEALEKSARNIAGVLPIAPEALNAYLVLDHVKVIIFKDSLPRIEEVFQP